VTSRAIPSSDVLDAFGGEGGWKAVVAHNVGQVRKEIDLVLELSPSDVRGVRECFGECFNQSVDAVRRLIFYLFTDKLHAKGKGFKRFGAACELDFVFKQV
tara:strand:+ start:2293 stop:2595 length:303 start_codon:yes stop_codon:yes gene_type:complete